MFHTICEHNNIECKCIPHKVMCLTSVEVFFYLKLYILIKLQFRVYVTRYSCPLYKKIWWFNGVVDLDDVGCLYKNGDFYWGYYRRALVLHLNEMDFFVKLKR